MRMDNHSFAAKNSGLDLVNLTSRFAYLVFGLATRHHILVSLRVTILLVSLSALIVGSAGNAAAELSLLGVRFGLHSDRTRVVFDLTGPTSFRAFALAKPHRVVVDMQSMSSRVARTARTDSGLVLGYRFGDFTPSTSRVVIDVAGPVRIEKTFLLPPDTRYGHRLVIDIRRSEAEVSLVAPPQPPPARAQKKQKTSLLPLRPPKRDRRIVTIAIDPGHGGADPGAIGVNGVYEKDITLQFARELRSAFRSKGQYRVILTRDDDTYVRLRERISIAREAGADLFLSLHADSLSDAAIRGASVYTLSENASDKEAAALAAKENRSDIIAGVDLTRQNDEVTSILIDLTQRESMNRSARYANLVLSEIRKSARVLRKSHRFAGFAVLKAPDVPSVLIELGYLSNRRDVRLLSSAGGRNGLVVAIMAATEVFFRASPEE